MSCVVMLGAFAQASSLRTACVTQLYMIASAFTNDQSTAVQHVLILACANFSPSSGICFKMSGLLKMGSRYCQVDWHSSQLSSRSCSTQATPHNRRELTQFLVNTFLSWQLCWKRGNRLGCSHISPDSCHTHIHHEAAHLCSQQQLLPGNCCRLQGLDEGAGTHGLRLDHLVIQQDLQGTTQVQLSTADWACAHAYSASAILASLDCMLDSQHNHNEALRPAAQCAQFSCPELQAQLLLGHSTMPC